MVVYVVYVAFSHVVKLVHSGNTSSLEGVYSDTDTRDDKNV